MTAAQALVQLSGPAPRPARDDVQVTRARVLGTTAWIAYRPDRQEAVRREARGLGAVLAWDLLDTLMDLPAGFPVPAAALSRPARRRVMQAAPGVVRVTGGAITRELVPAVTPLLAIVMASDWAGGLARASRFGSYCRRMVVGPGLDGATGVLPAASRTGIGVAFRQPEPRGAVRMLLEPAPVADWEPTTAWWRFCEAIYGQAGAAG